MISSCLNCNEYGHTFKDCKYPIISYGILTFKECIITKEIKFLLIQRRDSIGYIDFIRGKYNNLQECKILVEEMTFHEKLKILVNDFDTLWDLLWINKQSKIYKRDYRTAKKKFTKLDIQNMIKSGLFETKWIEQEFCIPKGRKNNYENELACAIREFSEETSYYEKDIKLLRGFPFVEENFIGSNGKKYRHIYFLAKMISDRGITETDILKLKTLGEVKNVGWYSYLECMKIFRHYESSKRNIIFKAKKILDKYV